MTAKESAHEIKRVKVSGVVEGKGREGRKREWICGEGRMVGRQDRERARKGREERKER